MKLWKRWRRSTDKSFNFGEVSKSFFRWNACKPELADRNVGLNFRRKRSLKYTFRILSVLVLNVWIRLLKVTVQNEKKKGLRLDYWLNSHPIITDNPDIAVTYRRKKKGIYSWSLTLQVSDLQGLCLISALLVITELGWV